MSKHMRQEVRVAIDENNPAIVRDEDLCVECRLCAGICNEYVGVNNAYDLAKTGGRSVCIHCGQCIPVCPTNSLQIKSSCDAVRKAVADPDKIVIFSTSPSVRVALGDAFGMADGAFVEGQMVELLRRLGGDYVLDTNFAADLTICEEAAELIERITKAKGPLPQFTSCCPAWVRYCETFHPEMIPHISSAKSPIGMQGPTVKTYFAKKMNLDPKRIVHVAVTPCTAKKAEILREEMNAAGRLLGDPAMRDTDYVITTVELADWAKAARINFAELPEGALDRLMGEGSGSGGIFGNGLFGDRYYSVPNAHNDFILSWIGNSAGFVGCCVVLGVLFALVVKTFATGARSEDLLGSYICAGIGGALMAQIAVNVGMNLRLLPVIGVTLPFYSAGGSSVLMLYICVGLVLSVYSHNTKSLFG